MASISMTTSLLASSAGKQLPTTARGRAVVVRASTDSEKAAAAASVKSVEESSNSRRGLVVGVMAVAATAFSIAKVALADEPKRGTPDAKKKYATVCATMPTARICHY